MTLAVLEVKKKLKGKDHNYSLMGSGEKSKWLHIDCKFKKASLMVPLKEIEQLLKPTCNGE